MEFIIFFQFKTKGRLTVQNIERDGGTNAEREKERESRAADEREICIATRANYRRIPGGRRGVAI